MQFWKILKKLIDDVLPDWRDEFLYYKDLKKQLKRIYSGDGGSNKRMKLISGDKVDSVADEKEIDTFVTLCQEQIDKFNNFVLDKQEWYIIIIEVLEGNLVAAKDSNQELMKVGRDLADLHGEIILVLNYIALNYIGLVKILKKHDKLSGALLRVPFIQKVLNEPFYDTNTLNGLVKKCETMLVRIFSIDKQRLSSTSTSTGEKEDELSNEHKEDCFIKVPEELVDIKSMKNTYMKRTLLAIEILKEIRSRSSTVSMFSLPPIQQSRKMEEVWKKNPTVEEVAK
ncbi:hypothetical protein L1987_61341 [Smallanthus sonchifolius]|uniref:Uncharacterized protein n=1 Tax=Smallanthus sonchifolius TaxID=185202 RepID=A0ACB9DAW1_9ASTR|nr:hypothetical protein L1987_61341 [Smallanthus sonchifolius]